VRNCTTVKLSMVGAVSTSARAADFHPLMLPLTGTTHGAHPRHNLDILATCRETPVTSAKQNRSLSPPGTEGSNPVPSSGESTNHRYLPDFIPLGSGQAADAPSRAVGRSGSIPSPRHCASRSAPGTALRLKLPGQQQLKNIGRAVRAYAIDHRLVSGCSLVRDRAGADRVMARSARARDKTARTVCIENADRD